MAEELVSMADQFKGLPMGDLIGGPLMAACDAQVKLANATSDFIKVVGFLPPTKTDFEKDKNAVGDTRTATFKFKRPAPPSAIPADPKTPNAILQEEVELEVPLLAIVKIPSLSITTVDIEFQMEVKSSFSETAKDSKTGALEAEVSGGWGPVKASVKISGSVSSSKDTQRSSDNSAKYTIKIHAEDKGMPEGLSRVLDIMQSAIAPKAIVAPTDVKVIESTQ